MYPHNKPKFSLSALLVAETRWKQRAAIDREKHEAAVAKRAAHEQKMRSEDDAVRARIIATDLEEEIASLARSEVEPTSPNPFEIRRPTEEELRLLAIPPPCVAAQGKVRQSRDEKGSVIAEEDLCQSYLDPSQCAWQ